MSKEPLSTRRMLAESLYGMLRDEYNQKQGRYRVPWDKLPEATRQIYITVMARFLLKHLRELRKESRDEKDR